MGNVDNRVYSNIPDWKVGLTDIGKKQAHDAGKTLKELLSLHDTVSFYYSPFYRAAETANIIRAYISTKISFEKEEVLVSEQCCGMPGSYNSTDERKYLMKTRHEYGKFYYRPPDGEDGLAVYIRAKLFVQDLENRLNKATDTQHQNVIIVSHGAFIQFFLMYILDWTVEQAHNSYRPNNGDIIHIENTDGIYRLKTELPVFDSKRFAAHD